MFPALKLSNTLTNQLSQWGSVPVHGLMLWGWTGARGLGPESWSLLLFPSPRGREGKKYTIAIEDWDKTTLSKKSPCSHISRSVSSRTTYIYTYIHICNYPSPMFNLTFRSILAKPSALDALSRISTNSSLKLLQASPMEALRGRQRHKQITWTTSRIKCTVYVCTRVLWWLVKVIDSIEAVSNFHAS